MVASAPVTTPITGELVIDYDNVTGNLTVYLVTADGKSSKVIEAHVGVVSASAGVYAVVGSTTATKYVWSAGVHAQPDVLWDTYSTIASAPGVLSSYSVGWGWVSNVSNTTVFLNVSVVFTGSGVKLVINSSWGLLKEADIGKPRSPCVVGVG